MIHAVPRARPLAALALLALWGAPARAQVDPSAGSEDSSDDPSAGSEADSEEATNGTIIATVITSAVMVVVTAVLLYIVIRRHGSDGGGAPGARARAILEAEIVGARGDLGVQVGLLVESPGAWDQLDDELARGQGPAADAMSRATRLPVAEVAARWSSVRGRAGVPTTRAGAAAFALGFVAELAPDLRAPDEQLGELAWRLADERATPDFPAYAPTHDQLARWLGVPRAVVDDATGEAFGELLTLDHAHARALVAGDPGRWLDRVAIAVEGAVPVLIADRSAALERAAVEALAADFGLVAVPG